MAYKNYLFIALLCLIPFLASSQEKEYTKNAIKLGFGGGINDSHPEQGIGLLYNIGYQTQLGKSDRLRINPNILFGGFLPLGISDTRDQFYRISALGLDLHGDVLRLQNVSLVLTFGGFMDYSRGLLGTGGESGIRNSSYFNTLYFGTKTGVAFRFVNKTGSRAFEFKPINFMNGNKYFTLGYLMFGMDFYLRK